MQFKDTAQRTLVCKTLFDIIGLGDALWGQAGPQENLEKWLRAYGGSLSSSQTALFDVALGIWNDYGQMPFCELLKRFEEEHLKAVGSLMIALAAGPESIDKWITVWSEPAYATA